MVPTETSSGYLANERILLPEDAVSCNFIMEFLILFTMKLIHHILVDPFPPVMYTFIFLLLFFGGYMVSCVDVRFNALFSICFLCS